MTPIEQAEKTITNLEDARQKLIQNQTELADERGRVALGAHTGDQKARKRLDAINTEVASYASEMSSIEAAITEAHTRVAAAQAAEALAADKANALQLRQLNTRFVELGLVVDEAFEDISASIPEMITLLNEMHRLGATSPTNEQLRVLGTIALKTAIQRLPQLWVGEFDFQLLAPNQKKTFAAVIAGWHSTIERNIEQRLQATKEAA